MSKIVRRVILGLVGVVVLAKERVVDDFYDPFAKLIRRVFRRADSG